MTDLMTTEKFTKNQEQFMLEIVNTKGDNLPAKIEDVLSIFEFTDFKAKAWKLMMGKMSKLEENTEAYNSALRSGQKWGIAALYAQKRMGEIIPTAPNGDRKSSDYIEKSEAIKKINIPAKVRFESRAIANNPEILDRVIKNSEERGEIPTKTAVLNTIRVEKYRKKEAKKIIKHNDRVVKEVPKLVKDYFNAVTRYKEELKMALEGAKRELFSPESINIISKKHEELRSMMDNLEGLI